MPPFGASDDAFADLLATERLYEKRRCVVTAAHRHDEPDNINPWRRGRAGVGEVLELLDCVPIGTGQTDYVSKG